MKTIRRVCVLLAAGVVTTLGADAQDAPVKHRVQAGDTVPRLSWQYKIRADSIRALNGLKGDTLTPGATILIPPTSDYVSAAPRGEPDTVRLAPKAAAVAPAPVPAAPPPRRTARETTSAEDLRAPVRKATPAPRAEAEPESEPDPPPRSAAKRRTTPTPGAPQRSNAPRDEPPLEDIVRPTPAPANKSKVSAVLPTPAYERVTMQNRREPNFLALAQQLSEKGIPYNGGWTPPGEASSWVMDCSNTCRWLYREGAGIQLPRTASDQYVALDRAGLLWAAPHGFLSSRVDTEKLGRRLKPGDLLFWENTYKPVRRPDITHVMLFLGTDSRGRWRMVGSQVTNGVAIYDFDPTKVKGGYRTFFGLFKHEGRFVAYGRPLGKS